MFEIEESYFYESWIHSELYSRIVLMIQANELLKEHEKLDKNSLEYGKSLLKKVDELMNKASQPIILPKSFPQKYHEMVKKYGFIAN